MIHSRKVVAAAILFGLALIIAGLLAAPFSASARAASGQGDGEATADRIGAAFASLSQAEPAAALTAAAARASKGDFPAYCGGEVWPNLDAPCLSTSDGAPARNVRTITIGYQAGENTTVLVRIPSAAVAQR